MDITKEIQRNHIIYGASDYTSSSDLAASKSLNYAKGATILKPAETSISVVPHTLHYKDTVGLFGAENYFLKVKLEIIGETAKACYEEPGWECAYANNLGTELDAGWNSAVIDETDDSTLNTYEPANIISNKLPKVINGYLSVELNNLKVGNRFIDDWLDVRLYSMQREEHPFDIMYVKPKDYFYIGIHARNTKRLPYNIECVVGREYRSFESIDNKLVMRQIS
ncbi:MAG: hypothetical protein CBC48_14245 [bacterium TMED88]|nr:MAG: hypothetical protein CBC48_14245 [bacterium TMED88]